MPTARKVSVPSEAVDSLDDGLPLSQGSTLVEPDDTPADNTQDDVSLMGQTITTSAAANTVTTVGYIVDALPNKPDFHTIQPKREKLKGVVEVAATAKGTTKLKGYITTANTRINKLENALNLERGYSDALSAEGKRIFTSVHNQLKGFHSKMGAALKKSAELASSVTSLTKENKDLVNALSAAQKREGVLQGKLDKAEKEASKATKQLESAKSKAKAKVVSIICRMLCFILILFSYLNLCYLLLFSPPSHLTLSNARQGRRQVSFVLRRSTRIC